MAFRVDIGAIMRPPTYLVDGAARIDALLTRTGVFIYLDEKGQEFREYRPPEEVFDPESMASFEAVPVTDDHPPVFVDASNVETYKCGRSGTIGRDGTHMTGSLIVESKTLLKKMKDGKREVSNGYECVLDMTPGVSPEGESYHAIQRKIRGNHIAIVDFGRAGTAKVRMDRAAVQRGDVRVCRMDGGAVQLTTDKDSASDIPSPAVASRNDAAAAAIGDFMNLEQALAALHATNEKLGAANEKLANEKTRADSAERERDAAKTRADKAEGERDDAKSDAVKATTEAAKAKADAASATGVAVKERVALVTKAALVLGADAKIKTDKGEVALVDAEPRDIRCAVITKVNGDAVSMDGKSEAYVEGRFDAAFEKADKSAEALAAVRTVVIADPKLDTSGKGPVANPEIEARKKMHEDSRNRWKSPTTVTNKGNN